MKATSDLCHGHDFDTRNICEHDHQECTVHFETSTDDWHTCDTFCKNQSDDNLICNRAKILNQTHKCNMNFLKSNACNVRAPNLLCQCYSKKNSKYDWSEYVNNPVPYFCFFIGIMVGLFFCWIQKRWSSKRRFKRTRISTTPLIENISIQNTPTSRSYPYGRVRTHFQSNKFYDRVSVASQESELCDSHSVEAICPVTLSESKKKHGSKKFNLNPEDFTFKEKIGEGQFGEIYKVLYFGAKCAVKKSKVSADVSQLKMLEEATLLDQVSGHPNVCTFIGFCIQGDNAWVVSQYYPGGNLENYLKDKAVIKVQKYLFAYQACCGVAFLHSVGIIHRDIAARNCLLEKDLNLVIADFGISRILNLKKVSRRKTKTNFGPIRWMALESVTESVYSTQTDVWMTAVLMWEILNDGDIPWGSMKNHVIIQNLVKGRRLPIFSTWPSVFQNIMEQCWNKDPEMRPTMKKLVSLVGRFLQRCAFSDAHSMLNMNASLTIIHNDTSTASTSPSLRPLSSSTVRQSPSLKPLNSSLNDSKRNASSASSAVKQSSSEKLHFPPSIVNYAPIDSTSNDDDSNDILSVLNRSLDGLDIEKDFV